uniref:Uncharacterized protein n=1 Tax=Nelumbo nucifera TaxID=4432 RepID=A0A822XJK0_NELNU|nr:TPA_asm: hypothetical protein HUJ06_020794 [Nelumbo nucifera]
MSSNALQGSIPWSFGQVTPFTSVILDLSNNNLTGEIPSTLTRSDASLQYLSLSYNNLHGEILSFEFNMSSLECMELNNNGFTGMILSSLSYSFNLKILNIRKNKLRGIIPSWISKFSNLGALLLGGNHFEGHIPSQLCEMQKLGVLDLSSNSLSWGIPRCVNNTSFWKEDYGNASGSSMYLTVYWETYNFYTRGNDYLENDDKRLNCFHHKKHGILFQR